MNYNLRVSMERMNNKVVTQLEVSTIGRARRRVINSPDFDQAMIDLRREHDALLAEINDYNRPAPAAAEPDSLPTPPVEFEPAQKQEGFVEPKILPPKKRGRKSNAQKAAEKAALEPA